MRVMSLRRINENRSIVELVRWRLDQRVESYHFALERLVIMTPSQQAVEVEQSLNQLQRALAYYNTHPAPSWERGKSLASSN